MCVTVSIKMKAESERMHLTEVDVTMAFMIIIFQIY